MIILNDTIWLGNQIKKVVVFIDVIHLKLKASEFHSSKEIKIAHHFTELK